MLLSLYLVNSGFGSHVSTCEGPPEAKIWMTDLALTLKCDALGTRGDKDLAAPAGAAMASYGLMPNTEARLTAPKTMPVRTRNSRLVKIMSSSDGECSRKYLSE